MAKRKKHHHRRRRIGAASLNPKSPVVMLAGLAAGYLLGDKVNEQLDKVIPASMATGTIAQTALMAGELGLGALLLLSKKKPSLIKAIAGGVLAGAGLKRALKKFGIIQGYQMVPVVGRRGVTGYQNTPVLNGVPGQLAGVPSQLQGFRVNGYKPIGSGAKVMGSVDPRVKSAVFADNNNGFRPNGSGYME